MNADTSKFQSLLAPNQPARVDLACGQRKQQGFIGIDVAPCEGVDLVCDLTQFPWPIPDNVVDEAFVSHYVEHAPDLMRFMDELYRILKPPGLDASGNPTEGGRCKIIAPYYNSMRCWQDPTHVRAISEASFLYYNAAWRRLKGLDHYPIHCDFDFTYSYMLARDWAGRPEAEQAFAIRHYTNVVEDIHVTLTKR